MKNRIINLLETYPERQRQIALLLTRLSGKAARIYMSFLLRAIYFSSSSSG